MRKGGASGSYFAKVELEANLPIRVENNTVAIGTENLRDNLVLPGLLGISQ